MDASTGDPGLAAEQRARALIDRQLAAAGWVVQHRRDLDLFAGQGVAVREVVMGRVTAGSTTCCTWTSGRSA